MAAKTLASPGLKIGINTQAAEYPFVRGQEFLNRSELGIGAGTLRRVTGTLQEGIYWYRLPGELKTHRYYNLRLLRDFFLNGAGPEHDKKVKEYLDYAKGKIRGN